VPRMLGMAIPRSTAGGHAPDNRYNVVMQEEAARALVTTANRAHPARR